VSTAGAPAARVVVLGMAVFCRDDRLVAVCLGHALSDHGGHGHPDLLYLRAMPLGFVLMLLHLLFIARGYGPAATGVRRDGRRAAASL
jgi:hypothetical protein